MHPFSIDYITRGGEVKCEAYPEYDADCFRDSPSPGDSGLESSSSSSPTSCDPRTKQNDDCITEVRKHYDIMPMQYAAIFKGCKNDSFQRIFFLLKT